MISSASSQLVCNIVVCYMLILPLREWELREVMRLCKLAQEEKEVGFEPTSFGPKTCTHYHDHHRNLGHIEASLTISLIFIGFYFGFSRYDMSVFSLLCLSFSWEAGSPSEPQGKLTLTKTRAVRNQRDPSALATWLSVREAKVQNGYVGSLERGLPVMKPI